MVGPVMEDSFKKKFQQDEEEEEEQGFVPLAAMDRNKQNEKQLFEVFFLVLCSHFLGKFKEWDFCGDIEWSI